MAKGPYMKAHEAAQILDDWKTGRFKAEQLAVKYVRCINSIRKVIREAQRSDTTTGRVSGTTTDTPDDTLSRDDLLNVLLADPARVEWFWSRITKTPSGCWRYRDITGDRYATCAFLGHASTFYSVHAVAYRIVFGPVPDGKELHHECQNKWCCNPNHLTPLTHAEHMHLHTPDRGPRGSGTSRYGKDPSKRLGAGGHAGRGRKKPKKQKPEAA